MTPNELGKGVLGALPGVAREQFHVGVTHVWKYIGADRYNPPKNFNYCDNGEAIEKTGSCGTSLASCGRSLTSRADECAELAIACLPRIGEIAVFEF